MRLISQGGFDKRVGELDIGLYLGLDFAGLTEPRASNPKLP